MAKCRPSDVEGAEGDSRVYDLKDFFHIQPGKTACIPGKNQLKPPLYILPENEQCLGDSFPACAQSSTLCWIKKEVLRLVFSFSEKAQPFERSCPRFHQGFITCGTCHGVLHGMSIRKCSLDKSGAWETPSPLVVFLFHLHRVWLCVQAFPCCFFHFFRCLQGHQTRSLPLWLVMHTLGCWQNEVVILDMWPCLHFAHVAGSPLAFHWLPSYCAAERGYCRCSSKRNTYTGCLLCRMGVRHPGFSNSAYPAAPAKLGREAGPKKCWPLTTKPNLDSHIPRTFTVIGSMTDTTPVLGLQLHLAALFFLLSADCSPGSLRPAVPCITHISFSFPAFCSCKTIMLPSSPSAWAVPCHSLRRGSIIFMPQGRYIRWMFWKL